jgi:uncharacterized membrane protein
MIPAQCQCDACLRNQGLSMAARTLRDYFAAAAMASVYRTAMASVSAVPGRELFMSDIAADAYAIADAMLKERAK